MPKITSKRLSERRSEYLLTDLLQAQGWDVRCPPKGDVVFQSEYSISPDLAQALSHASKSGKGRGIPESILVDAESLFPLAVIEAKGPASDMKRSQKWP